MSIVRALASCVFVAFATGASAVSLAGTGPSEIGAPELRPPPYHAQTWSTSNGLAQGSVNDLLQTPSGELWIATFGGLLRFDGVEFRTFDLESLPTLPSQRMTALASDGADGLWVATQDRAIVHFRDGRVLELMTVPASRGELIALERGADGVLWTRVNDGALQRCSPRDRTWTTLI